LYFVGAIPGKPSLNQMNHFLSLIADDFLPFWQTGMYFSCTAKHDSGRWVNAAIIPLIADLPAARQMAGFGSHSMTFFCSYCYIRLDNMKELDRSKWPSRDHVQHLRMAKDWRDAPDTQTRKTLFGTTGIRWTELLRLPYWIPIHFSILESMHNHYLGLVEDHCRHVWGMNIDTVEGDGVSHPTRPGPPQPSRADMSKATFHLRYGTLHQLGGHKKAELWHLCAERGLRRASTKGKMVKELHRWVSTADQATTSQYASVIQLPSSLEELRTKVEQGERLLAGGRSVQSLVQAGKPALQYMCQFRNLSSDGTRLDMANRLIAQVTAIPEVPEQADADTGNRTHDEPPLFPSPPMVPQDDAVHRKKTRPHVLGADTLPVVHADAERTELPPWVARGPKGFGTSQRGKLTADQWRTICTVHIPITLIRLWANSTTRKRSMLKNYMDLVSVINIGGMLETTEGFIQQYDSAILRYLEKMKELYPEAPFHSNHHLAIHLGQFLRLFGPVHSWRGFFFERFNHLLQGLHTNMRTGAIEAMFLFQTCRASNLRSILQESDVKHDLGEFVAAYEQIMQEDSRGTRISDTDTLRLLNTTSSPASDPSIEPPSVLTLDIHVYGALLQLLNNSHAAHAASTVYLSRYQLADAFNHRTAGREILWHKATFLKKIVLQGVTCCANTTERNILLKGSSENLVYAAQLQQIFSHKRRTPSEEVEEVFLVIQRLAPLAVADVPHDPYRQFGYNGGFLCYNRLVQMMEVVRPSDFICHFARTRLHVEGIAQECVHALPQSRVCTSNR
ncbi:hypothetical protein BC835DRAFT_1248024, partial [Cytidiella melzeri]